MQLSGQIILDVDATADISQTNKRRIGALHIVGTQYIFSALINTMY